MNMGLLLAALLAAAPAHARFNFETVSSAKNRVILCKVAAAGLAALKPPAGLSDEQMRLAAAAQKDAAKYSEVLAVPGASDFIQTAERLAGKLELCGEQYAYSIHHAEAAIYDWSHSMENRGGKHDDVKKAIKEYNDARDLLETELANISANPVIQSFGKGAMKTFYLADHNAATLPTATGARARAARAAEELKSAQDAARAAGMRLTQADLDRVIAWMQRRAAAASVDYCYRRSDGRGAGYPLSSCAAGTEKDGALCYPKCKDGYKGVGPVCWQTCPAGYVDTGAFCHVNKALTRSGSWHCPEWYSCRKVCPSGYTNAGLFCALTTPSNPPGWSGDGLDLTKDSYVRGAGSVLQCAANQEQNGALCYPRCAEGFHGEGPVCWQNCYGGQTECGVGCAKDKTACGLKTADMVIAPLMLAANILTLGGSSEVTAARAEVTTALKAGDKAAAKAAFGRMLELYADNLAKLTSEDIAKKLEEKFAKDAARWVAKEYVKVQYYLAVKKDDAQMAESVGRDLAGLDPTGVAQTVEAYVQPKCALDEPMPAVTPL